MGVLEGDSDPRFNTLERPQDLNLRGLLEAVVPVVEKLAAEVRKKPHYDQHQRAPATPAPRPANRPAAAAPAKPQNPKPSADKPQMGFGV